MHRLLIFLALAFTAYAQETRHTPLTLTQGGTPDKPAVFDGHGLIIDLGIDVTSHDWEKHGDLWTSRGPFEKHPPIDDVQRAALFIEEVPIRIVRDRAAEQKSGEKGKVIFAAPETLQTGQMGFKADGSIYFRWPAGKTPGSAKIYLPPEGLASGVNIACSYITIKNITALHAANDGFNIHGPRVGIRLENVKAFSNGDEGISAHETVQMDVFDSEIAWNGSNAGGVADVNDCVTTYTNCEVHHNLGAGFFLEGKYHRITHCLIHHQSLDIAVRGDAVVEQHDNEWRKP
ncbi:right-handed parallel beta-helix repeat-containing protein [Prosthecobacter fluviatilis]|uniref:Right-handed parallel beta-helix repeat-containing protein n=1 Tax=Prosthecobacter fluviatilis TaxID=445931 RepID=A0ABW0KRY8_9BACT